MAKTSGITAITNILRSESTGSIHVTSSRPDTPPAIRFNFLSAALDREVTLEAMRITRRIMTAPAMKDVATEPALAAPRDQRAVRLRSYIRRSGACRCGW